MRPLLVVLVALALTGCGVQRQSADTAATPPAATATTPAGDAGAPAGGDAATAAPQLIAELTSQAMVYECPKCGMMFDRAGTCSMGCGELVATQVAYTCPKDNQAVAQAGQCPRCPMNARVEKTAMAAAAPAGKN